MARRAERPLTKQDVMPNRVLLVHTALLAMMCAVIFGTLAWELLLKRYFAAE